MRMLKILGLSTLFLLAAQPAATWAKPDAPEGVRAETVSEKGKTFVRLTWNAVEDATGYDVYRARADKEDDFSRLAKVKKPGYEDRKAAAGRSYMYYVTARDAKGGSDKSEIAKITVEGGGDGKASASRSSKAADPEWMFDLEESDKMSIGWFYQYKTGALYYTNTGSGTWSAWSRFGTLDLPPDYKAGSVLQFATDPTRIFAWVWNPDTERVQFSTCNLATRTFNPWVDYPSALPKPPNWKKNTRISCDCTPFYVIFLAYNPDDGTIYISRTEGNYKTWSSWEQYGNMPKPPNYSADAFITMGIRNIKDKADWAFYSYNFTKNTLYLSLRLNGNFSWQSWQSFDCVFGMPPGLTN